MRHNEDTRVKIPALIHLTRLGYDYFEKHELSIDEKTNIAEDLFLQAVKKLNPQSEDKLIEKRLTEIKSVLKNEDKGREFYNLLINSNDIKLIDFNEINENHFACVTELEYKSGRDNFRPDITVFVNGLPLSFLEVKIPNNKDGIFAERDRINKRFSNPIYNQFFNITQLLIFSNNMEYDDIGIHPYQGAFYGTPSKEGVVFNFFREQEENIFEDIENIDSNIEKKILLDNKYPELNLSEEFQVNKSKHSPTNRIITSLLSKKRFLFFLKYGLVYVDENVKGKVIVKKHIIRYQQLFALKKMAEMITSNIKKGIIWHTQGSGKTALSYFSIKYIIDLLSKENIIPRFYFIVDRLDLLTQAKDEFEARGLVANTVSTRDELMSTFTSNRAIGNPYGKDEITVVNIQKFKESNEISDAKSNKKVQRIYFIDESHRGYKKWGTFLTNLLTSDKDATYFALTGTPLIQREVKTKEIFGDYIHNYFYNESIADGITLRLMRDPIEKEFQLKLKSFLESEVAKGSIRESDVLKSEVYVSYLLPYIVNDFLNTREIFADESMGGMIVAHSTDQARELYKQGIENYEDLKFALILSDEGSKDEREELIEAFENEEVDILIVYRMLLTGFDQHRLKKLYLGRLIEAENLLQAVTRVNRLHNNFKYGYIVDFADIRKEFDKTNKLYLEELQEELGDELENYREMFVSFEEAENIIKKIKEVLFSYDIENKEIFVQQLSKLNERSELIELKKILSEARDLYNMIKISEHKELLDKLDFKTLNRLLKETDLRLNTVNYINSLDDSDNSQNLLNIALKNIEFKFSSLGEEELRVSDEFQNILHTTREEFTICFDKKDKEYLTLEEELKRVLNPIMLESKELSEDTIDELEALRKKIETLNGNNNRLATKYNENEKFARIHKRVMESEINISEVDLFNILQENISFIEENIFNNLEVIKNIPFFKGLIDKNVLDSIESSEVGNTGNLNQLVSELIIKEYQLDELEVA